MRISDWSSDVCSSDLADVILPSPSEATHSNFHFFYIPFMVRKIAKWTAPLFETEAGQIHDWDIFLGLVSRLNGKTEHEVERDLVTGWLERFCADGAQEKCRDLDLERAGAVMSDKPGPDRVLEFMEIGRGEWR